jgi:hypothetical protein
LDATPWPVIADLLDYWGKHPPVHDLVRLLWAETEGEDEMDEDLDRTPFTLADLKRMAGQR